MNIGLAAHLSELSSNAADMLHNNRHICITIHVPYAFKNSFLAEQLTGVGGKKLNDFKLPVQEGDFLALKMHFLRGIVDYKVIVKLCADGFTVLAFLPPQVRFNPCAQLIDGKRFNDVIVTANRKSL